VVRVPGYRSRGPGQIPGTTIFSEKSCVWNGPLSLASAIEEPFEEKVAAGGIRRTDHVAPYIRKSWH
jgi:hypothetical protein